MSKFKVDDVASTSRGNVLTAAEIKRMWTLTKVYIQLGTTEQCIRFAEEHQLIPTSRLCPVHKMQMTLRYSCRSILGRFVCRRGVCRAKGAISRAIGTWFDNIKISLPQVFYLMYCFANHWSIQTTRKENFVEGTVLSNSTITDWFNYCREVVVEKQIENQQITGKIGGIGKIVQIDRSKFGKRKYNKGGPVEGDWVVGMIEDGSDDLRLEVCPDNIKSSKVLISLIKKHVADGTTIHTDCWKAYDCLGEHGFVHKRVNHSDPENPFVASDGTHTQRIDSQWRVVKRFFSKHNYNHPNCFADVIVEYLWRKSIIRNREDPFIKLVEAVKDIYKE